MFRYEIVYTIPTKDKGKDDIIHDNVVVEDMREAWAIVFKKWEAGFCEDVIAIIQREPICFVQNKTID